MDNLSVTQKRGVLKGVPHRKAGPRPLDQPGGFPVARSAARRGPPTPKDAGRAVSGRQTWLSRAACEFEIREELRCSAHGRHASAKRLAKRSPAKPAWPLRRPSTLVASRGPSTMRLAQLIGTYRRVITGGFERAAAVPPIQQGPRLRHRASSHASSLPEPYARVAITGRPDSGSATPGARERVAAGPQ
jgi:hypothetical protein